MGHLRQCTYVCLYVCMYVYAYVMCVLLVTPTIASTSLDHTPRFTTKYISPPCRRWSFRRSADPRPALGTWRCMCTQVPPKWRWFTRWTSSALSCLCVFPTVTHSTPPPYERDERSKWSRHNGGSGCCS